MWFNLHDVLLGYGSPDSAHYKSLARTINDLDWNDTFISLDHLKHSFPDHQIVVEGEEDQVKPPLKLHFDDDHNKLTVSAHMVLNRGPYERNVPKKNSVRFTPTQIEAIRSGMQPGLTMVVGPSGTGKTGVAVQIISNIYHNFPDQRTLIVTHSNLALNQLFEKIMQLDIDERHLLRLGHGEEQLETEEDFSRYGRVDYILNKRMQLLEEVGQLQSSIGVAGEMAYTCETAFFHSFVYNRYIEEMKRRKAETPPQPPTLRRLLFLHQLLILYLMMSIKKKLTSKLKLPLLQSEFNQTKILKIKHQREKLTTRKMQI